MENVTAKLVSLALASENLDEAVSALKKARKHQPTGKLMMELDQDWAAMIQERDELRAEREEFEAERKAYQRRILLGEEETAKAGVLASLGGRLMSLAKPAGIVLALSAVFGGAAYAMTVMGDGTMAPALVERICDSMGTSSLFSCES